MTQSQKHVSGLIFYSDEPEKTAQLYRELLQMEINPGSHGPGGEHLEGDLGGIHIAVLQANPTFPSGTLVPVFLAQDIASTEAELQAKGIKRLHKTLDIGEGKRVVSFADNDGRPFRLIHIDHLAS